MPKNGETRPFFSLKNLISVFGNYMDVKTVVAAYFLFFNFLKKNIGRDEDFDQAKGIYFSPFCCQEQSEQALAGKMCPCSKLK